MLMENDRGLFRNYKGSYESKIPGPSKFGKTNKYLDLQYNLYVCTSLDDKTVVKIVAKGKSRFVFLIFMKIFTCRQSDL